MYFVTRASYMLEPPLFRNKVNIWEAYRVSNAVSNVGEEISCPLLPLHPLHVRPTTDK